MPGGRPPMYKTAEEMQLVIDDYFDGEEPHDVDFNGMVTQHIHDFLIEELVSYGSAETRWIAHLNGE